MSVMMMLSKEETNDGHLQKPDIQKLDNDTISSTVTDPDKSPSSKKVLLEAAMSYSIILNTEVPRLIYSDSCFDISQVMPHSSRSILKFDSPPCVLKSVVFGNYQLLGALYSAVWKDVKRGALSNTHSVIVKHTIIVF